MAVDTFKRSSKIKRCLQFEVDFLKFCGQKERKLSEFAVANLVRGIIFKLKSDFVSLKIKLVTALVQRTPNPKVK